MISFQIFPKCFVLHLRLICFVLLLLRDIDSYKRLTFQRKRSANDKIYFKRNIIGLCFLSSLQRRDPPFASRQSRRFTQRQQLSEPDPGEFLEDFSFLASNELPISRVIESRIDNTVARPNKEHRLNFPGLPFSLSPSICCSICQQNRPSTSLEPHPTILSSSVYKWSVH